MKFLFLYWNQFEFFFRDVIGHWASGTGGAGVFGALTYAGLIQIGFTPKSTMLLMLLVPFCQALAFFVGLKESNNSSLDPSTSRTSLIHHHSDIDHDITIVQPEIDFVQKVNYLPNLMKYVLPLFTVYVCEYFINQGLVCVSHSYFFKRTLKTFKSILYFHLFVCFFSVWVNIFSELLVNSWCTISLVPSNISNRRVYIAVVNKLIWNEANLANVNITICKCLVFCIWSDLLGNTNNLDCFGVCILGRLARWLLLREYF